MILSRDMILCETESAGLFWDFFYFFVHLPIPCMGIFGSSWLSR
jgi:hypothetical protein